MQRDPAHQQSKSTKLQLKAALNFYLILREQANKMYDVLPYYFAKTIAEIPVFTIIPVIFTLVTYFMVGYND